MQAAVTGSQNSGFSRNESSLVLNSDSEGMFANIPVVHMKLKGEMELSLEKGSIPLMCIVECSHTHTTTPTIWMKIPHGDNGSSE